MEYIVIEDFNDTLSIVSDEEGDSIVFDDIDNASDYAENDCQDGQVVPLGMNLLYLISASLDYIEQSDYDLDDPNLKILIENLKYALGED